MTREQSLTTQDVCCILDHMRGLPVSRLKFRNLEIEMSSVRSEEPQLEFKFPPVDQLITPSTQSQASSKGEFSQSPATGQVSNALNSVQDEEDEQALLMIQDPEAYEKKFVLGEDNS